MTVYCLWIYEKPGEEPILYAIHKTQESAEKILRLYDNGFILPIPLKD